MTKLTEIIIAICFFVFGYCLNPSPKVMTKIENDILIYIPDKNEEITMDKDILWQGGYMPKMPTSKASLLRCIKNNEKYYCDLMNNIRSGNNTLNDYIKWIIDKPTI